ncbi:MAG TPA: sigma factor [Candidatus Paceibacterota bacterium]|nr:sigma factor [Candidatus Paceibacterota bacterium]
MNISRKDLIQESITRYLNGDEESFENVLHLFEPIMKAIYRKMKIKGTDIEDYLQECRIDLFICIKKYNPLKGSFVNFGRLVIHNKTITRMNVANSQKKGGTKIDRSLDSDSVKIKDPDIICRNNPVLKIMKNETAKIVQLEVQKYLSPLEFFAFWSKHILNKSYKEIGSDLQISTKDIDNACSRSVCKLRKNLERKKFKSHSTFSYEFVASSSYKYPEDIEDYDSDGFGSWSSAVKLFENRDIYN